MGQNFHILVIDADRADVLFFQHVVSDVLQNTDIAGHHAVFTGRSQLLGHRQRTLIEQVIQVACTLGHKENTEHNGNNNAG